MSVLFGHLGVRVARQLLEQRPGDSFDGRSCRDVGVPVAVEDEFLPGFVCGDPCPTPQTVHPLDGGILRPRLALAVQEAVRLVPVLFLEPPQKILDARRDRDDPGLGRFLRAAGFVPNNDQSMVRPIHHRPCQLANLAGAR